MSDLVSRVLEAIAEAERDALEVPETKRIWWGQVVESVVLDDDGWLIVRPVSSSYVQHVARHDPAAVLRRCAADRRAISMCQVSIENHDRGSSGHVLALVVLTHIAEGYGLEIPVDSNEE